MIEIRPIAPNEAEVFLRLLCNVFSLDFSRARGIFFHEPLFDIRRKWALFDGKEIVSILTAVPLQFGWGRGIGIAGVATDPKRRGKGFAKKLLDAVCEHGRSNGEETAYLFARDTRLYAKSGFEVLDEAIYGVLADGANDQEPPVLTFDEVRAVYDAWSASSPARLRRDDARWNYWKWNLRICNGFDKGYVCVEGNLVRECVTSAVSQTWPVGPGRQWFGLRSMAQNLNAPIGDVRSELILMGRNAPGIPQMFMTDQF